MAEPMTTPTRPRTPVDPNVGIPDLMHRLRDDAGRLARDEVRLAKLEIKETLETGAHGLLWLVIGFGVAAITLVAWTIFVATLIAALAGHAWIGALAAGVLDLAIAALLVLQGVRALGQPSYTMEQTRESIAELRS